jgi:hypothetical protein
MSPSTCLPAAAWKKPCSATEIRAQVAPASSAARSSSRRGLGEVLASVGAHPGQRRTGPVRDNPRYRQISCHRSQMSQGRALQPKRGDLFRVARGVVATEHPQLEPRTSGTDQDRSARIAPRRHHPNVVQPISDSKQVDDLGLVHVRP